MSLHNLLLLLHLLFLLLLLLLLLLLRTHNRKWQRLLLMMSMVVLGRERCVEKPVSVVELVALSKLILVGRPVVVVVVVNVRDVVCRWRDGDELDGDEFLVRADGAAYVVWWEDRAVTTGHSAWSSCWGCGWRRCRCRDWVSKKGGDCSLNLPAVCLQKRYRRRHGERRNHLDHRSDACVAVDHLRRHGPAA